MAITAEEHIFGKHRAQVVDNNDPEQRGRILVICPTLSPKRPKSIPASSNWADVVFEYPVIGWCSPAMSYGHFTVPPIGAGVWLEFEAGHPQFPIYSGVWYSKSGKLPDVPSVPDFVKATPPTKRITSSVKHRITLDDTDDEEQLDILSFSGHKITLDDSNNKVVIKTSLGHTITLDDTSGNENIEILHSNGEYFKIDKDGKIHTNSNASGSDDFFVLKKFLTQYFDTHTHTGNLGAPTSPPIITSSSFTGVTTDKV
jgi:uncharacterized protein involved in type VI secretion and phage assembly